MTREKAIELDNELKDYLYKTANSQQLDGDSVVDIVYHSIEIIPEEVIMGMIYIGKSTASYKPGNVRVDLKKTLSKAVNYGLSVNKPDSVFGIIQLLIASVIFVFGAIKQELTGMESYLVYFLHVQGAYNRSVEEEQFIRDFSVWYQQKTEKYVERADIVEAINHLYEYKITDFENGNIVLKEKVWGEI